MNSITNAANPLGKNTEYKDTYDASLLFAISRDESWKALGKERLAVPFDGVDIWNGYELSWLNTQGKPVVCLAEFRVPALSPNLIESKSFKLYLNSYNQTQFANAEEVQTRMAQDLSAIAGAPVQVKFHALDANFPKAPSARCIDELEVQIEHYQPAPELLRTEAGLHEGWLVSHLLKSNCPVTGQPDWGSVFIHYQGPKINEAALLAYIVSMRQHQGFHEQCCEQIYQDLMQHCQPEQLTVYARYVRRGGLDINPFRSSQPSAQADNFMLLRQ